MLRTQPSGKIFHAEFKTTRRNGHAPPGALQRLLLDEASSRLNPGARTITRADLTFSLGFVPTSFSPKRPRVTPTPWTRITQSEFWPR